MRPQRELALVLAWCAAAGLSESSSPAPSGSWPPRHAAGLESTSTVSLSQQPHQAVLTKTTTKAVTVERLAFVSGAGELWVARPNGSGHAQTKDPDAATTPHPAGDDALVDDGSSVQTGSGVATFAIIGGLILILLICAVAAMQTLVIEFEEEDEAPPKHKPVTREVTVSQHSQPVEQIFPPQKPSPRTASFNDKPVESPPPPPPAPVPHTASFTKPPSFQETQPTSLTYSSPPPIATTTEAPTPMPTLPPTDDVETIGSKTDSQGGKTVENLCPPLLVPSGMEFIFVMPEVIEAGRQEDSFNVVDLNGSPLSHVVISERTPMGQHRPGIYLQTLAGQTLAVVYTEQIHTGTGKSPLICWPSGAQFAVLKRDSSTGPTGRYKLKHRSGQKLLTFHGDFLEKAINVVNHAGKLVCATERRAVDFDKRGSYYQVRVAPHVDAGIVICSLLLIDKLEKQGRA